MQKDHCLNYNHGRPNAPVRFCSMCGEVVNKNISAEVCDLERHAKKGVQETNTVWIAVNNSFNKGHGYPSNL